MTATHYMIDRPDNWQRVRLDAMDVLFHRPSGQTHILIEPAPQIFDSLLDGMATAEAIHDHLSSIYTYEMEGGEDGLDQEAGREAGPGAEIETGSAVKLIKERLEEMVALGFVSHAARQDGHG